MKKKENTPNRGNTTNNKELYPPQYEKYSNNEETTRQISATTKGGLHRGSCKPPLFGDSDKLIEFEGFVMDFGGF